MDASTYIIPASITNTTSTTVAPQTANDNLQRQLNLVAKLVEENKTRTERPNTGRAEIKPNGRIKAQKLFPVVSTLTPPPAVQRPPSEHFAPQTHAAIAVQSSLAAAPTPPPPPTAPKPYRKPTENKIPTQPSLSSTRRVPTKIKPVREGKPSTIVLTPESTRSVLNNKIEVFKTQSFIEHVTPQTMQNQAISALTDLAKASGKFESDLKSLIKVESNLIDSPNSKLIIKPQKFNIKTTPVASALSMSSVDSTNKIACNIFKFVLVAAFSAAACAMAPIPFAIGASGGLVGGFAIKMIFEKCIYPKISIQQKNTLNKIQEIGAIAGLIASVAMAIVFPPMAIQAVCNAGVFAGGFTSYEVVHHFTHKR